MRILLVNTRHFRGGGDSTYTFNLTDLLRSKGHQVAFFAMQDLRNLPDSNSDLFVSHIDFNELNQRKSLTTGVQVLGRAIYSREARRKFSLLLDRFTPDVVHLQTIHAHITPSVILEAKRRRLPVVWTLHDHKLICPNSRCLIDNTGEICEACVPGKYYQAILKRCKKGSLLSSTMAALEAYAHQWMRVRDWVDLFIVPSQFLRAKVIQGGLPSEKVHQLPHMLPENSFYRSDTDKGYLLFLGNIASFKGVLPLLAAVRQVPEAHLILAGPVQEPMVSQLPDLLPSNARYVGLKNGKDLDQLIKESRAIVLPSLCYETQGLSVLEGFARGKPAIASRGSAMAEVVEDQERGILVKPGDVPGLIQAISWVTTHQPEAREMGVRAFRYVMSAHNPQSHYETLYSLYSRVTNR